MCINDSLQTGQVPQDWRDANVTPLHKKGSRQIRSNYRPVSLTSQVVKVLERIVYDKMLETLMSNNTLHCDQHGFQDKCSCVTQLLECLYDWTENWENKYETDVIYLDFAKAFDTVPHLRLIHKLRQAGIRGRVLNWIENFLKDRRQRVVLRNGVSGWRNVTSGVPQGSILGPLLFLIYVNDIPENVKSTAKLFADDTKLYRKIENKRDCETLQEDLNSLACWSNQWLLRFNEAKCVAMELRKKSHYKYTLNGVALQTVHEQKDLGITVNDTLHPRTHIQNVVKKANQRIGIIKRCFTGLDKKVCVLYRSIIRPVLEYAAPAWSTWLKKDIDLLESVQERCLSLASGNEKLDSLRDRRKRADLTETYKMLNGYYKNDPNKFFSLSQLRLRGHPLKLTKQHTNCDRGKYFFSNRVVDDWNSLPTETATAPSLSTFKKRLRSLPKGQEG